MIMSQVSIIIGREFNERVRKKSFIITTLLMPLLMIGLMFAPMLIMKYSGGDEKHIAVIDESGLIAPRLQSGKELIFEPTDLSTEAARKELTDKFGVLYIGSDILTNPNNVKLYANSSSSLSVESNITGQIEDIIEAEKLKSYNIENLSQILQEVKTRVGMQTFRNDESQEEEAHAKSSVVATGTGFVLGMILYMFLLIYGSMVMQSVIEEKNSRVLEVMVSSVRPFDLMLGKILGVASVAVVQVLIWGVLCAVGAAVAVLVMCLLPNAGSFGMAVSAAMVFGLVTLMFLDTSINMAMQPFKMLVGDMVNEKQKALAYSIQSFLCNAGSLVGYVFPFFFTALGIANTAPSGVVPDSVIWSFYIGAAILILCVIYTTTRVKEWTPAEYAEYNGTNSSVEQEEAGKADWLTLLRHAPATFWKVGLVQFFCWFAFMYMWTYTNGTVAANCWGVDMFSADATATSGYQEAGNWVGMLFAVQAIGSVVWAMVLPQIRRRKLAYSLSLLLGGVGFVMAAFVMDKYVMFVPFLLIGCAWAAMLAMPFTFVTNALHWCPCCGLDQGRLIA